jgi:hypothetical protein
VTRRYKAIGSAIGEPRRLDVEGSSGGATAARDAARADADRLKASEQGAPRLTPEMVETFEGGGCGRRKRRLPGAITSELPRTALR